MHTLIRKQPRIFQLCVFCLLFLCKSQPVLAQVNDKTIPIALKPSTIKVTEKKLFTLKSEYRNSSGVENIKEVQIYITKAFASVETKLRAKYNHQTKQLFIMNYSWASWIEVGAPGSQSAVVQRHATLDSLKTKVYEKDSKTLVVEWAIIFNSSEYWNEDYLVYLAHADGFTWPSDWKQLGSLTFSTAPTTGALIPPNLTTPLNKEIIIRTGYSDQDGTDDLLYAQILIGKNPGGKNALRALYNHRAGKMYVSSLGGGAWVGGFEPGSDNIIDLPHVSLNCKRSKVIKKTEEILEVQWAITFKSLEDFGGVNNVYFAVGDYASPFIGWDLKGDVNVNSKPSVEDFLVKPEVYNIKDKIDFSTTITDADQVEDIKFVELYVRKRGARFRALYNNFTGEFAIYKSDYSGWHGGCSSVEDAVLEQSHAILDCSRSKVEKEGNDLRVTWVVKLLSDSFVGRNAVYVAVTDTVYGFNGWRRKTILNIEEELIPFNAAQLSLNVESGLKMYSGNAIPLQAHLENQYLEGIQYQFVINDDVVRDFSNEATFQWTPNAIGLHTIEVIAARGLEEITHNIEVYVLRQPISPTLERPHL